MPGEPSSGSFCCLRKVQPSKGNGGTPHLHISPSCLDQSFHISNHIADVLAGGRVLSSQKIKATRRVSVSAASPALPVWVDTSVYAALQ